MTKRTITIDMENTGKEMSTRFASKQMNYTDIANELGVSISTVSYWMNGKKLPSLSHILEITEMLECKVEDIIVVK